MRLHQSRLRGLGPYAEEVLLDLDNITGDFVVITGLEGAGKSILAEAFPGAIHPRRKTPTRGTFEALAEHHGRDSFVDVAFTMGIHHYRLRHEIGRGESYVYQDGIEIKHDKKVSAVGAWLESTMLSPEVVNACTFLGQRSEGLIDADGADRRAALLRAIGIDAIEALAKRARAGEAEAGKALAEVVGEIGRLTPLADALPVATERHRAAVSTLEAATSARTAAAAALAAARASLMLYQALEGARVEALSRRAAAERRDRDARARVADLADRHAGQVQEVELTAPYLVDLPARRARAEEQHRAALTTREVYQERERARGLVLERRAGLQRQIDGAGAALLDLTVRAAAQRALLAGAPALAARSRAARAAQQQIEALRTDLAASGAEETRAADAAARARGAAGVERARWSAARIKLDRAVDRLRDREAVLVAVETLPGARAALAEDERQLVDLERTVADLRAAAAQTTGSRISTLRGALGAIEQARQLAQAHAIARAARAGDDGAEQAATDPDLLAALDEDIAARRAALTTARAQFDDLAVLAARSAEIEEAVLVAAEAGADREAAERDGRAAKALGIEEDAAVARAREAAVAIGAEIRQIEAAIGDLGALAREEQALAGAAARVVELEQFAVGAQAAIAALEVEIGQVGAVPESLPAVDLGPIEAEIAAVARLAARERDLAAARVRVVQLDGLLLVARGEAEAAAGELTALEPVPEALDRPDVEAIEREVEQIGGEIERLAPVVAAAERARDEAQRAEGARADAIARRPGLEEALSDWHLLAECLGIGGVQALEIDAAGPVLTANMNRLLHGSYGPRYTAEVNATRSSKDGRKRIDETEILVLDTLAKVKRKADVRTYSGGERAHLCTAFFLALAQYVCNTRGIEGPTLFLDEPGGGLKDATVGPWIDMVRHGARLIGTSKLVVISHHQQIIDAADAVVHVADGKVMRVR